MSEAIDCSSVLSDSNEEYFDNSKPTTHPCRMNKKTKKYSTITKKMFLSKYSEF